MDEFHYPLILDWFERREIDAAGKDRWNGHPLRNLLIGCRQMFESPEIHWNGYHKICYFIPVHVAYDILELAKAECGDNFHCPCFSSRLENRFITFLRNII